MSLSQNLLRLINADQELRSPSDFAKRSGLSRQTVNLILKGKIRHPKPLTVYKIVKYFGCTEEHLIGYTNKYKVASNLKKLMSNQNISINALSKSTGVSKSVLSRILRKETPNPKDETLLKICDFFNISLNEFR